MSGLENSPFKDQHTLMKWLIKFTLHMFISIEGNLHDVENVTDVEKVIAGCDFF
jgi:hypothetical protein